MWLRCGVNEWHLDCLAGADLDLNSSVATQKNHDFIAAVTRKDDDRFELFISDSQKRVFDSSAALNEYLMALGLNEIGISMKSHQ